MKNICRLFLAVFLLIASCLTGCSGLKEDRDTLFQFSTIDELLEGSYDGNMTYKELAEHGDFGIGTFDRLDGEMIGCDGKFYQIKANGVAYPRRAAITLMGWSWRISHFWARRIRSSWTIRPGLQPA